MFIVTFLLLRSVQNKTFNIEAILVPKDVFYWDKMNLCPFTGLQVVVTVVIIILAYVAILFCM